MNYNSIFKNSIHRILFTLLITPIAFVSTTYGGAANAAKQTTGILLNSNQQLFKPGALSSKIITGWINSKNKLTQLHNFQKTNPFLTAAGLYAGLWASSSIAKHIPIARSIGKEWTSFTSGSYGEHDGFLSTTGKWAGLAVRDLPKIVITEGIINQLIAPGLNLTADQSKLLQQAAFGFLLSRYLQQSNIAPAMGSPLNTNDANLAEGVYRNTTLIPAGRPRMSIDELTASCSEEKLRTVVSDIANNPNAGGRLLITGESGLGKTFWAEQAANALGRDALYLNANEALYQGKYYGEINEKFNALTTIGEHFNIKKGSFIIVDEIDTFILKEDGADATHQTNTRKMVMNWLDHMTQKGYIIIMISNKMEKEIHPQVNNRFSRIESSKDSSKKKNNIEKILGVTSEAFQDLKKNAEDFLKTLVDPTRSIDEGLHPRAKNIQKNFGWGIVEKQYPNILARMQICDNVINQFHQNGNRCLIADHTALTNYIAQRTEDTRNGLIAAITKNIISGRNKINIEQEEDKKYVDIHISGQLQNKKAELEEKYEKSYQDFSKEKIDLANKKHLSLEQLQKIFPVIKAENNLSRFIEEFLPNETFTPDARFSSKNFTLKIYQTIEATLKQIQEKIKKAAGTKQKKKKKNVSEPKYLDKKINPADQELYNQAKLLLAWAKPDLEKPADKNKQSATNEEIGKFVAHTIYHAIERQKELTKLYEKSKVKVLDLQFEHLLTIVKLLAQLAKYYPNIDTSESSMKLSAMLKFIIEEQHNLVAPKNNFTSNNQQSEDMARELYHKYFAFVKETLQPWQINAVAREHAHLLGKTKQDKKKFKEAVLDDFGVPTLIRRDSSKDDTFGELFIFGPRDLAQKIITAVALRKNALGTWAKHSWNEAKKVIHPATYKRRTAQTYLAISTYLEKNKLLDHGQMIIEHAKTHTFAQSAAIAKYLTINNKKFDENSWNEAAKKLLNQDTDIFFGKDGRLRIRYKKDENYFVVGLEDYLRANKA